MACSVPETQQFMVSFGEHGPVYLVDAEGEGLQHGSDKVGSGGGCTQTQKTSSGSSIIHRSLEGWIPIKSTIDTRIGGRHMDGIIKVLKSVSLAASVHIKKSTSAEGDLHITTLKAARPKQGGSLIRYLRKTKIFLFLHQFKLNEDYLSKPSLSEPVDQPGVNGAKHNMTFISQMLHHLIVLQHPLQSHVYLQEANLHSEARIPVSNQGISPNILPCDKVVEGNPIAAVPSDESGSLRAQTQAPDITWTHSSILEKQKKALVYNLLKLQVFWIQSIPRPHHGITPRLPVSLSPLLHDSLDIAAFMTAINLPHSSSGSISTLPGAGYRRVTWNHEHLDTYVI
ncbi:hypothetical protein E2C01_004910 [Portunus trituberculatus]|uniref:Uncharacterized protein n=1 Tax=Portunus trituberculatus TaxID=210409 RepID=A0A5B7CRY8_PORTR|nr:hypothetical protein [Portunus trituberculatus]